MQNTFIVLDSTRSLEKAGLPMSSPVHVSCSPLKGLLWGPSKGTIAVSAWDDSWKPSPEAASQAPWGRDTTKDWWHGKHGFLDYVPQKIPFHLPFHMFLYHKHSYLSQKGLKIQWPSCFLSTNTLKCSWWAELGKKCREEREEEKTCQLWWHILRGGTGGLGNPFSIVLLQQEGGGYTEVT